MRTLPGVLVLALVALVPSASAATVNATIYYHELAGGFHMQVNDGGEQLHVTQGDVVTLTLDNTAKENVQQHNFTIDGYSAAAHGFLAPGTKATVTFTADTVGSFAMYCGVPGHRAAGMVALLVVKVPPAITTHSGTHATPGTDLASVAIAAFAAALLVVSRRRR